MDNVLAQVEQLPVDHNTVHSIINTLPKPPNIIYFRDNHNLTPECTDELLTKLACTWTCVKDWEQLACELKKGHQHLAFHMEMIERTSMTVPDFLQALETMRQFKNSQSVLVAAVIKKHTTYQTVKQLKKAGVAGMLLDLSD